MRLLQVLILIEVFGIISSRVGDLVIRIAIVDDNKAVCGQLETYLIDIAEKKNVRIEVEPYNSGERFCYELSRGERFDLVFLDIELYELSGIDVSRFIRSTLDDELQQIVFISANQQYSLELHSFHPLDFLVKEITRESLESVFIRFLKIIGEWNDTFEFKVSHDICKIKIGDIRYLTVTDRIVYVVLNDRRRVEYYGTLENAYSDQLVKCGFLFLHKKYIVNPMYVEIYEYDKVIMDDGEEIPIGSSRRKEIRALLSRKAGDRRK